MSDRPIVYGARYYFPGEQVSHSHLYRIRPDGTGRRRITSGKSDDTSPVWSPDGKWIAFSRVWRNEAHPDAVCLVSADDGPVRTVFPVRSSRDFSVQWLNNTHLLVYCRLEHRTSGRFTAFVVSIVTGKIERTVLHTWEHSLSLGGTYLTAWSDGLGESVPTRVVHLREGREIALPEEVGGECTWLDEENFVALSGTGERPTLIICSHAGKVLRTVPIRRSAQSQRWLVEASGKVGGVSDSVASFIDPLPGRKDYVLVGWQLRGSQDGRWAATYKVNLQNGEATPWAVTDTLVPSPSNRFFLTTRPRDLVAIASDNKWDASYVAHEWGAPLLLGTVANPTDQRFLVSGAVWVDGFDWRNP